MAFQGNLHLLPKNDFLIIEEEMKKLKLGPDYDPAAAVTIATSPKRKWTGRRRHRPQEQASAPPAPKVEDSQTPA